HLDLLHGLRTFSIKSARDLQQLLARPSTLVDLPGDRPDGLKQKMVSRVAVSLTLQRVLRQSFGLRLLVRRAQRRTPLEVVKSAFNELVEPLHVVAARNDDETCAEYIDRRAAFHPKRMAHSPT